MKKTSPQKSPLTNNYSQAQLISLEQSASNRLEEIIEYFGLDLSRRNKFFVGSCPVHGGSNTSAFNIFHSGDVIGNWRCFTHNCHQIFNPTLTGFIRAMISVNKYGWTESDVNENICPFREAVAFIKKFIDVDNIQDLNIDYDALEKNRFSSQIENVYSKKKSEKKILNIPRESVIKSLQIPAQYFINRGFSKEILEKYDVGLCCQTGKEMNMRAVAPIYNDDRTIVVGCTGRSIFDKCPTCNAHHNITHQCPMGKLKRSFTKWKHNAHFPAEDFFYNYWYAKEHISRDKFAVLVESPGNVWRLEEAGIHNSLCMFGTDLSDRQRDILDKSGALALVVLTDPDHAGILGLNRINESCGSSYSIYSPKISNTDLGDTPISVIKNKLFPIIENIKRDLGVL